MSARTFLLGLLMVAMVIVTAGCNDGPNQQSMVDSQKKLQELDKKDGNTGSQE
jgi:hypothetical protein